MLASGTIVEEILDLKRQRRAILLAHHYQEEEIQELADVIGDSLELARKARQFEGDVIAFCGVWFMAETAKLLNPERIVVVPDREAGCSLVDSCPADQLRAFKRRHPDHCVVSYINTSVEVKAESDILCTSRNAVDIINSIPPDRPILFTPDVNLGNWVQRQTGRQNMKIWQGACIVHATFPARRLSAAKAEHPRALGAAHGRFRRLHRGDHRLVWPAGGGGRVHRNDRERRALLARAGGARQAVLLRAERKLQLQRMPVHEEEHAREAARRAARPGAARGARRGTNGTREAAG
jgi:hypothetical protein